MSQRLISRSDDLRHLRDDGYELEVRAGHLLVHSVPYVDEECRVQRGTLVSTLALAGDVTTTPETHVVTFVGTAPCSADGQRLEQVINSSSDQQLAPDLVINHVFSSKPAEGYPDYHAKVTAYVAMLSAPAQSLDPDATACTFAPVADDEEGAVFHYLDTAASRAGIAAINEKLRMDAVAIIGLGGTGAYVLDLVAKTPVVNIHLFDGDTFQQHNAFRAPGAPTIAELRTAPSKVGHFAELYGQMRRGLHPHAESLDESNLLMLDGMDFVFICIDDGDAKRAILDRLIAAKIAFVDVGMGIYEVDGKLGGALRVTASTDASRGDLNPRDRIPLGGALIADEYATNIQTADLNALNATLAVIKWKKIAGFYSDLEHEHFSVYEIDGNSILNEDSA